jgi:histidyl-tRNA synthetase
LLDHLRREFQSTAPEAVEALAGLLGTLSDHGVDLNRVRLDLGFGRTIGFYSQMMFELLVETPNGAVEVCGGGRYDGLAREIGSTRDDRGVGFAFGLQRLDEVLRSRGMAAAATEESKGYLVITKSTEPAQARAAVGLAGFLRANNVVVILDGDLAESDARSKARQLGLRAVVVVDQEGVFRIDLNANDTASGPTTVAQLLADEGIVP